MSPDASCAITGSELGPAGSTNGELPRITSAAITESVRRDIVIFINGNHDVRSLSLREN